MNPGAPSELDLGDVEARIRFRLRGRISELSMVAGEHGLVLRGRAVNYYAKQLAQHAAMVLTGLPIRANEIEVP
jgi:hypothetical protein